jgi:hypothetical protein
MRHLGSIVLCLVLTPVIYLLIGVGVSKINGDPGVVSLAIGCFALATAGLLYAILTMTRISPVGPVLAGLTLIGVQIWALAASESFRSVVPRRVLGVPSAGTLPAEAGYALLLAVPLLLTIVSPRRWRRSAQPVAPAPYAAPAAAPYGYQPYAPSYPPPPGGPMYPGAPPPSVPTSAPPVPVPVPAPADEDNSATRPLYPPPSSFPAPPPPQPGYPWPAPPVPQPAPPPSSAPPVSTWPTRPQSAPPAQSAPPPQSAPPAAPVRRDEPPADDTTRRL